MRECNRRVVTLEISVHSSEPSIIIDDIPRMEYLPRFVIQDGDDGLPWAIISNHFFFNRLCELFNEVDWDYSRIQFSICRSYDPRNTKYSYTKYPSTENIIDLTYGEDNISKLSPAVPSKRLSIIPDGIWHAVPIVFRAPNQKKNFQRNIISRRSPFGLLRPSHLTSVGTVKVRASIIPVKKTMNWGYESARFSSVSSSSISSSIPPSSIPPSFTKASSHPSESCTNQNEIFVKAFGSGGVKSADHQRLVYLFCRL